VVVVRLVLLLQEETAVRAVEQRKAHHQELTLLE
jgi:hypothetical protein